MSSALVWTYRLLLAGAVISFVFSAYVAARVSPMSVVAIVLALGLALFPSRASWAALRRPFFRRTLALLLACTALSLLISGDVAGRPPTPLVLVGAAVIAGEAPGAAIEDAVVVLDKAGQISSVGARDSVAIPDGVEVIDVTGKYVMPGLINAHDHLMMLGSRHPGGPEDFSDYDRDNAGGALGELILRSYPVKKLIL